MAGGFQNKYYFFKESKHSGERLTEGAPGYISFWESNDILKINILLENITNKHGNFAVFLQGGTKKIKATDFTLNKKSKNDTMKAEISLKIKLPVGLTLSDFDTVTIDSSDTASETFFEAHSPTPCEEKRQEKEQIRIEESRKLDSPENIFRDLKQFDPFNTTNHAYKWWLCESYNRVCETLHKMDIHLPGYVSKSLYANMQFFKHAILGKYTSVEDRCFVIVGIPVQNFSQTTAQQSPARPMVCRRFINNSGYKGYLLFYIDYVSTAMVKAVVV